MKITFKVKYHTNWGESVYICGSVPQLGSGHEEQALLMTPVDAGCWAADLEMASGQVNFDYHYLIKSAEGRILKREWQVMSHECRIDRGVSLVVFNDLWRDRPDDVPFYSTVFTECIRTRGRDVMPEPIKEGTININVISPCVERDQVLAICGSCEILGNWDPEKAMIMDDSRFPLWSVSVPMSSLSDGVEYKFVILRKHDKTLVCWDSNSNARIVSSSTNPGSSTVISSLPFVGPANSWRGAGVAIPVFSLRSDEDFGVGDFYDLIKMAQWAKETGQKVIQLLPINDTTMTHTWTDSYPYNSNSTFALHPMYLRLEAMGKLNDVGRRNYYEEIRKELNSLADVDYERVNKTKEEYAKEIFRQEKDNVLDDPEFNAFVRKNSEWLKPYAVFCVLRDLHGTPDIRRWGEFSTYDKDLADDFASRNEDCINYVYFVQYHLDKQMRHVRDCVHSLGVALKGDIPIGVARDSVDVWLDPRLFNLDCSAGAPPDDFSAIGQNWGFPTYNWHEMSKDGFAWWKARFRKMGEYFDAYRIDHLLGFFRIWQIPLNAVHGLLGIFNSALPFTPEELRFGYDFCFDKNAYTIPCISGRFLPEIFGEYSDEVISRFLEFDEDGRYKMRPEFNTQRKVAEFFASQPDCEKNRCIRNGLLRVIEDVLFIEDPYEEGKFHPRILAKDTCCYASLNDYDKWNYDRLYDDFFYRRNNKFWEEQAMWKLPPLIDATRMLVCAEDLGMIPACVPEVMERLEILSLEIQRMPKKAGVEFGDPSKYPYFSVCTTSTHDMGGIRKWWEDDHERSRRFYNEMLHEHGSAPYFAEPWICDKIVTENLASPSMLCILPLQDWLSIDGDIRRTDPGSEQINDPANPRHYWRYRMHLTLEALLSHTDYNNRLRDKIRVCGR